MSAMPSTPMTPYPDSPLMRALFGQPGQPIAIEYGPPAALSAKRVVCVVTAALNPDGTPADPDDVPVWVIVELLDLAAPRAAEPGVMRWERTGRHSPIRWYEVRTIEYGAGGRIVTPASPPRVTDPYTRLTVRQAIEVPDAVMDKYVAIHRVVPDLPASTHLRAVGRLTQITVKGPDAETVLAEFRLTDLIDTGTPDAQHAAHDHLDLTLDVRADDEVRVYDPV